MSRQPRCQIDRCTGKNGTDTGQRNTGSTAQMNKRGVGRVHIAVHFSRAITEIQEQRIGIIRETIILLDKSAFEKYKGRGTKYKLKVPRASGSPEYAEAEPKGNFQLYIVICPLYIPANSGFQSRITGGPLIMPTSGGHLFFCEQQNEFRLRRDKNCIARRFAVHWEHEDMQQPECAGSRAGTFCQWGNEFPAAHECRD